MSKIKIPYEVDNEDLPSPTKELRDVPFSRVSKTIVKVPDLVDSDEWLSTPTRRRSDIFNADESPLSASSRSFGSQEPGSSPILRDKKPESSVKKGNTSKLNEKYAMMQQKMTQMAQDNETPLAGIFPHETTVSRSSTPDFRRHGLTFQPETPRWKSAPRLKTSHASPFVTPPHRKQQKSFPNTMRKHATRFTSVWPPKLLSSSSLTEDQDDEEKLDELLGPAPVSPSPSVPRKRTYSEIDHISNLTNNCEIYDDEEEPDSPKRTYTNIYTRQLTQQSLSLDDAANPPLVIDDELFYDSNEVLNLANL
ncbi:hypothetical protein F8M41_011645 [Gigaspora margarita]|uniref:Uncharacterized protein n=1 Tax=Gigaspora margarita TaxID=4874 RepID=A0A8H3WZ29_GIGMA|nr:hypothetical protein F8M41_011645 [Gigaspora margarita]